MILIGTAQARLFLTKDLLARDGIDTPALAKRGFRLCEKLQRFQPVEDLVPTLDLIASNAGAA
jgi:hypothetical protein